jgi:hypothetical protein
MISASIFAPTETKTRTKRRKIPAYLVRDTIDGVEFYYPGFRQVLGKRKQVAEIRGDGGLTFFLKLFLADALKAGLNNQLYRIGCGQLGFTANNDDNMELGVVIFDRAKLTPEQITPRYVTVAPEVVIEIDVNVELPDRNSDLFQEYVIHKVENLFKHGVEKVIWFFTKSKKVFIALPNQPWQMDDWNKDVVLFENVKVNIAAFIEQEGFKLE